MSKNRAGAFIGGLLVGTAIGTITGLLMAPRSGRETRQLLKKSADALPELIEDLSTTLQLHADRLSEATLHRWEETLLRLREAIETGVEVGLHEHQILNQVDLDQSSPDSKPSSKATPN